jgi:hypothetical protein
MNEGIDMSLDDIIKLDKKLKQQTKETASQEKPRSLSAIHPRMKKPVKPCLFFYMKRSQLSGQKEAGYTKEAKQTCPRQG